MRSNAGVRVAGIFFACLIGIGGPMFLLGPAMFHDVSWGAISAPAFVGAFICGILGIWLFIISCFAATEDVQKVLEIFDANEAALLLLPYMIMVGSKSVWRRLTVTRDEEPNRGFSRTPVNSGVAKPGQPKGGSD